MDFKRRHTGLWRKRSNMHWIWSYCSMCLSRREGRGRTRKEWGLRSLVLILRAWDFIYNEDLDFFLSFLFLPVFPASMIPFSLSPQLNSLERIVRETQIPSLVLIFLLLLLLLLSQLEWVIAATGWQRLTEKHGKETSLKFAFQPTFSHSVLHSYHTVCPNVQSDIRTQREREMAETSRSRAPSWNERKEK